MVICLELGAYLHTAQLMPLPLTVSCFSKIQIGFTFLLPAYPGSPGQRAVKRVCVGCKTSQSVMLWLAGGASRVPATAAGISEPHPDECRSDDIYEDLCALRRRSAFFKVASDATNGR